MLKKILALLAMLYAAASFAAVDVNKANAAELDSVKGIGPALSAKIVDERKKGSFKDWDDLINRVKGIGDKSAAKLSEGGLTVNGAEYKGASATAKDTKAAAKEDKKSAKADQKAAAKEDKADAKKDAKEAKAKAKEDKKQAKADAAKPAASDAKTAASGAKK